MLNQKYQKIGADIAKYIQTQKEQPLGWYAYSDFRVIVAGSSGSGKTRAVDYANELLQNSGIVECSIARDVIRGESIEELLEKVKSAGMDHEDCGHIAITMMNGEVAEELGKAANLPVFRLD